MTEYLLILAGAVFVNNIMMVKILGLRPFMVLPWLIKQC